MKSILILNINIKQECIPVGCVPFDLVAATRCQYQGISVSLYGGLSLSPVVSQSPPGGLSLHVRGGLGLPLEVEGLGPPQGGLSLPMG